jgi:hypothetical protein
MSLPTSDSWSIYSSFVFKNDQIRIEGITAIVKEKLEAFRDQFKGDNCSAQVSFIHSGGQQAKKQRSATAFRWLDCAYHTYINLTWTDKFLEQDTRGSCQKFKARLRPFSMLGHASFINFPDGSLIAYFGNNRQKLKQVKQIWDKDNYFDWAQGIRLPQPAQTTADEHEEEVSDGEVPVVVDEEGLTDKLAVQQWETQPFPLTENWLGKDEFPHWWFYARSGIPDF